MRSVFEYDNYRHFLRDYLDWQRSFNPRYSLRFLALKAGFKSHSFLHNVIAGKRNLTLESIDKVVKAFALNRKEGQYLRALAIYNQASTFPERENAFKEMGKIRMTIGFYRVQAHQYAYYSQWFLPVLRELAVYSDWGGDFRRLALLVRPALTAEQARQGIETLLRIGMLMKTGPEEYAQADRVVSAEDVPGFILRQARTQFMLRAIESTESLPPTERHASYAVMAMSRETYAEITRLLDEERKRALVMAAEDRKVDGIYAINIQVFPLSAGLRPSRG